MDKDSPAAIGPVETPGARRRILQGMEATMAKFILWLILLCICWPLALIALILYPLVWLLMLPFRLIGITVEGVFSLLKSLIMLPARILGGAR